MRRFEVVIIGAGASGITAAIAAKRQNKSVLLCERMQSAGKKILASGNGRCNLLNDKLDETCYNPESAGLIRSVLSKFNKDDIYEFFKGLGLEMFSEEGRIFPATNQAASVLKVLEMELKKLSIPVELNFQVSRISESEGDFIIASKTDQKITAENLVICTGGKSYPALGSDGSGLNLAAKFGHKIIEPVPAAVPLVVKSNICHFLQGQKISVKAASFIGDKPVSESKGDLLFTQYGLSGTAVLDISREISVAINRHKSRDVSVRVDLVPFMERDALKECLIKRQKKGILPQDVLTGILPNKFGNVFSHLFKNNDAGEAADKLKDVRFDVTGTRGWNEAEFTAGGISAQDINQATLESKLKKRLYFAGEIIDVDGKRGGYNLAWAWASGFVAGLTG